MSESDELSTCRICRTGIRRHLVGGVEWGAWLHDNMRGWGVVPAGAAHRAEPIEEHQ